MEIKYLKPHNGFKIGDTENVPVGLGEYLIRCSVAELVSETPKAPDKPKTVRKPRTPKAK